jgi:hypothetical protein
MVTAMFKLMRTKRSLDRSFAMQKILEAARFHGGELSASQAAGYTGLALVEVSLLLQQSVKAGYAVIAQDEKSGIVWLFPKKRNY